MKKQIAWILLAAMLLSLVACNTAPANDTQDDVTLEDVPDESISEEPESETEPESIAPDFPTTNMDGKVFNVFTTDWYGVANMSVTDLHAETITGDSFNDAIFDRVLYMQEKYNCGVASKEYLIDESPAMLESIVMADDGSVDWALLRGRAMKTILPQKLLVDLETIPNLDLSNPWWDQNALEALSIGGTNYAAISDLTINDECSTWLMFFNKPLIKELGYESPYDMFHNGTWTMEKFFEICSSAYDDLDRDGALSEGDRYGVIHTSDAVVGLFTGSNVLFARKNSEDIPELSYMDELSMTRLGAVLDQVFMDTGATLSTHSSFGSGAMFRNRQSLFYMSTPFNCDSLRAMDDDFGMICYPKADEDQPVYYPSYAPGYITMMGVPKTTPDSDLLGIFLEEFAYYGMEYVRPEFYETLIKGKTARDVESLEMIDYAFNNRVYDWLLTFNVDWIESKLWNLITERDRAYVSYFESSRQSYESELAKVIESLNEE